MSTFKRSAMRSAALLVLGFLTVFSVRRASAQSVTILPTEGFTADALPSNWSGNWGSIDGGDWFWSSTGYNGSNGAAVDDIWDYNYTPLSTPPKDVSSYAHASDSVWVDFDFFWEYNSYDPSYSNVDRINMDANSDVLVDGYVSGLYTYYSTSDGNYNVVQSSPSDWKHYHILIPVADRTTNFKFSWVFVAGQGLSDIAVDNVTITAFHKPFGELSLLPKQLNFGSATPNSPDTLIATAYNVGVAPVHITGRSFSGSSSFSLVSGPLDGDSIMPGGSVQFAIQFLPLGSGSLSGRFTLQTDAPDSGSQSVNLNGIGAVPSVSYGVKELFRRVNVMLRDTSPVEYIPVTSTGIGPLHFNSIYFIGLNSNNYSVSRMPQNPLPPDATDSIGIRFVPSIEGRPDAKVVISTDASNRPLDTVALFGAGTLPRLVITVPPPGVGNTVNFDSVAIGDSVCQTIQLTNPGTDTLHILKQLVTYGDYDFSFYPLTGGDTAILPGGGTQLVDICFKPLKAGSRFANIRFYTNIPQTFEKPSRDTSQFLINVTGVGVPYGHLEVIGSLMDTATVGDTQCVTVMLKNNGQADVSVNGDSLSPDRARFQVSVPASFTLAPGQTQPLTYCFAPSDRGLLADTLYLRGTTADQSFSQAFLLTGVGVVSCVSADSAITFGSEGMTMVGATDTSCITVTNCGDLATTYTVSSPNGPNAAKYMVETPLTSAVIPAGGMAQFCVVYTPSAIGAESSSVQITGGPSAQTVRLRGVGAGVIASASGQLSTPVPLDTCNTFTVTITNNGNVPWTPGTGTIGGPNAADFSIVGSVTPSTIPAGGTGTLTIDFCPKNVGSESMALTFPNSSPTPVTAFSYSVNAIGASSGVAVRTSEAGFSIGASYPNPTSGSAEIRVTLPYEAPVRIDLIDATGATVKTAFEGRLAAGSQTVALDARGLASGIYFVQLSTGDLRLTRPMSILK